MKNRNLCLTICLITLIPVFSGAQAHDVNRGNAAAAEQYVRWAENAIEEGRWAEALIVLERGADYSDVSSDLSYLLALARIHFNKPKGTILYALRQALAVNYWKNYNPQAAMLLEAENLIAIKAYQEALNVLSYTDESLKSACLRLIAFRLLPRNPVFFRYTMDVMERYPRDTEPVRIFLDYLKAEDIKGTPPMEAERQILDLIQRRLPLLLADDPELAWMAAPYIRDTNEAVRLVAAYRAINKPSPGSIPVSLNLGIIDEKTAVNELFNPANHPTGRTIGLCIDVSLLDEVWGLLRNEEGRELFRRGLSGFYGTIVKDINKDGIYEASAVYLNGMLSSYSYDEDQDGLHELTINFMAGDPESAAITVPAEAGSGWPITISDVNDQRKILVRWERYPAVLDAFLDKERFIPRPLDFYYAPVYFRELSNPRITGDGYYDGFLFPEKDDMISALTRRVLIANSFRVERPSLEFDGATETVELNQSIPIRAWERLDGRIISETDFLNGRPIGQRVDLDLDGRLETFRSFRRYSLVQDGVILPPEVLLDYSREYEFVESDWAGDGNTETYRFFGDL